MVVCVCELGQTSRRRADLCIAVCKSLHAGLAKEPAEQRAEAEREAKLDVLGEVGAEVAAVEPIRHLKVPRRQVECHLTTAGVRDQRRQTI